MSFRTNNGKLYLPTTIHLETTVGRLTRLCYKSGNDKHNNGKYMRINNVVCNLNYTRQINTEAKDDIQFYFEFHILCFEVFRKYSNFNSICSFYGIFNN